MPEHSEAERANRLAFARYGVTMAMAIDTILETARSAFRATTAEVRPQGRTDEMAENFTVLRATRSREEPDIVMAIDGVEGVTALDANIEIPMKIISAKPRRTHPKV